LETDYIIQLLTKAKLPDTIRSHDLRHFTARTLLTSGADLPTTQAVLGHTDASITLNYYAHVIPNRTQVVVNRAFEDKSEGAKPQ
jgi:site-specific recombinase XerD